MTKSIFERSAFASAVFIVLLGCGNAGAKDVEFAPVVVPSTIDEKISVIVTDEVTINNKTQDIGFTELFRTGDTDNGETWGLM
jgi:hypothetical protein